MAFLLHSTQEIKIPDGADKIIKAEDFWAYRHASEIVDEGLRKQEGLIRAGERAYVEAQERGYEAGLEAARIEQSRLMMTTVHRTVAYLNGVERQIAELVMSALRRLISDFSDKEKLLAVVKIALAEVRNQKQITLKANPELIPQLKNELARMQELYPMVSHIELVGSAELALDACIIETEIGIVEASVTGQLRALHQSLSSVFETKSGAAVFDDELRVQKE
jgi:type III secretion protein L